MPGFGISVDDANVAKMLSALPGALGVRLRQLIEGAAIDAQREMRIAAPVAVTGELRQSIRYSFNPSLLQAEVMPNVAYAEDVESGTKPHYVSVAEGSPLRAWALHKGANPYAVQRAIMHRGTKAHPFVTPVYTALKPKVEKSLNDGIRQLVQEANSGGL